MKNRWLIPFAGFLLALMGGFSYAWGVFTERMVEKYGWTKAEISLPFSVFMIVFAVIMVPAGRLQDKFGPRKVAISGAILFFIAYALSSYACRSTNSVWLVLTYGLLGGTACGLTYACVAPTARKWFPDKPASAVSFGVMGFGLAALVVAPLKAQYLIPTYGIEGTLLIMGIVICIVSLVAAMLLRNPPDGWKPNGWIPQSAKKSITIRAELTPRQMLASPVFYIIWTTYALVMVGGLMAIKNIPPYGEFIKLTPVQAAFAISIFAACNGFGRPLAGLLADRLGAVSIMLATYILSTITFLTFHWFATSQLTLYISSALLGWSYAVTLALFPALTSICFGTKHLGINYGIVFTAFGIGALGPLLSSWIVDVTKSYTPAFILVGVLTGIAVGLCTVLKKKYDLP